MSSFWSFLLEHLSLKIASIHSPCLCVRTMSGWQQWQSRRGQKSPIWLMCKSEWRFCLYFGSCVFSYSSSHCDRCRHSVIVNHCTNSRVKSRVNPCVRRTVISAVVKCNAHCVVLNTKQQPVPTYYVQITVHCLLGLVYFYSYNARLIFHHITTNLMMVGFTMNMNFGVEGQHLALCVWESAL